MTRRLAPVRLAIVLSAVVSGSSAAQPTEPASLPFVGGELDQDTILERLANARPRRIRQVGTSSTTLRLSLGANGDAAYKPRTSSHPSGYLAEIAAYRLARFLALDNVPPVVALAIPRIGMRERFDGEFNEEWEAINDSIIWDRPGVARGAAIYWIPRMESSDLASVEALDGESGSWLRVGQEIPEGSRQIARDLSIMLAFDYLVGNWDRFSGGNVTTDPAGRRLFMRDHNVAFYVPLTTARYRRLRQLLERVERFSRSFIVRLRALDEQTLDQALAQDPEAAHRAVLTPAQRRGVFSRRRALLSYVGARIAIGGARQTLAFD